MRKIALALVLAGGLSVGFGNECMRVLYEEGNPNKALEVGMQMLKRNKNDFQTIWCTADALIMIEKYDIALEASKAMLAVAKKDYEKMIAYKKLGDVYLKLGQYDNATFHYLESLSLAEKLGDKRMYVASLTGLADVNAQIGKLESAIDIYKGLVNKTDDPRDKALLLLNLSNLYAKAEDLNSAIGSLKQAIELREEVGDLREAGEYMVYLAELYRRNKEYDLARRTVFEGLNKVKKEGAERAELLAYKIASHLFFETGNYKQSLEYAYKTIDYGEEIGYVYPDPLFFMSAIIQIKPELKEYLMELAKNRGELLLIVEGLKDEAIVKELVAQAQQEQQKKTQQERTQAPREETQKQQEVKKKTKQRK